MAYGASFLAANRTKIFRVRPVHFYEGYENQANLLIQNSKPDSEEYIRDFAVFSKDDRFDMVKTYSMNYSDNLNLNITIFDPVQQKNVPF